MKTLDLTVGTTIENAALKLVKQAPSRADFNGIIVRAKYATTQPADIVTQYRRELALHSARWSPERTARHAQWAAEPAAAARVEGNPIAELKALLGRPMIETRPGDHVSLLDEEDPEGGVALRREDGTPVIIMSTEAYETFMEHPAVREAVK